MRAVVWRGEQNVAVEDVPSPQLGDEYSAIVEVQQSSICGSDLHLYHARVPVFPGTVLGHEAVGIVVDRGSRVERLQRGDRVLVPAVVGCGQCAACRRDYPVGCQALAAKVFGVSPALPGVQAEFVRVPFADYNLWRLPASIGNQAALMLADIFPTGFYAAQSAAIQAGDVVVVLGCGPVGLCAVQCAQLFSPAVIVAVDPIPARRERAAAFGALPANPNEGVVDIVSRLTDGCGADAVIEAVGSQETLRQAVELVRTGGHIAMVGVLIAEDVPFPLATAFLKDITLRTGLVNVPRFLPSLFRLVQHGKLHPEEMVTHTFPLSDAAAAYRLFDRKENGCLKVCLEPRLAHSVA